MACFTPLKAYRAQGGRIVFTSREGWSDRPIELACGQCVGCRLARSREWALRCMHEASLHERNCFITLTYRPEDLPADGSVDVRHWQLFAKRLRKRLGPFRFLHVGEYGETNYRPHYHACIFGQDFSADRVLTKEVGDSKHYTSPTLESVWGHGYTHIGLLTMTSAAYVSRYCVKKLTGPQGKESRRRIDTDTGEEYFVRPEYLTMSRRPGLAAGWFEKYVDDVYPSDEVIAPDGSRHRPPKFYDAALERTQPQLLETLKQKRRDFALSRSANSTPERLSTRELSLSLSLSAHSRHL